MSEARREMLTTGGPDHARLKNEYDAALREVEDFTAKNKDVLNSNVLEYVQSAGSVIDPTPASDLYSSGQALIRGDYVGSLTDWLAAWCSGLNIFFPGSSAPAKALVKNARHMPQIYRAWRAGRELSRLMAKLKKAKAPLLNAQHKAAQIIQKKRLQNPPARTCRIWGTTLPKDGNGRWLNKDGTPGGKKGNSIWESAEKSLTVEYKNGYPDFRTAKKNGNSITYNPDPGNPKFDNFDGTVEIADMGGGADRAYDYQQAQEAMRKYLNDPDWKKPDNYTWHHGEDGKSMTLIYGDGIHHGKGSAAHTGGYSLSSEF